MTGTESVGLPITRVSSANQNVAITIPSDNLDEWPPCLAHKRKHGNGAKEWLILNKTFTIRNVARLLMA